MKTNIKKEFPIFKNQKKLVYLDNGATTQINFAGYKAMNDYHLKFRANVHRGTYPIAEKATEEFENARIEVAEFINAKPNEIIFNSGTTAGLNFLANAICPRLGPRDNVVVTSYEHHANLIPWQQAAKHFGFTLRFIELDNNFHLDFESAKKLIDNNTKVVSFALASNVLGIIAPAKKLIDLAKTVRATTIIDAAQAIVHLPIDVKKLDCDFLTFSGHKAYGPNGIGVLYGKSELLNEFIEPNIFGGEMVSEVSFNEANWAEVPHRFEAGTPNISGAIGLGASLKSFKKLGWKNIIRHEDDLTKYAIKKLQPLVKIFGPTDNKDRLPLIAFNIEGVHPHDVADILTRNNVATRSGLHCAEPLHRLYHLPGTTRASFGIYNSKKDVDILVKAIKNVKNTFKV